MMSIDFWAWVSLAAILGLILYRYLTRSYNFWESQGVTVVKPYILFGSISIWPMQLHLLEKNLYQRLGRVYGRYDGQKPVLTVADPDLVKKILVKDFIFFPNHRDIRFGDPIVDNMLFVLEDEDWKRVRSTVSPAFTSTKLRRMMKLIQDNSDNLMEHLNYLANENIPLNCQRVFGAYTMDVIASSAFGVKINSLQDPDNPFVTKAKLLFQSNLSWRTCLTVMFPWAMKFFRLSLFNPEAVDFFRSTTLSIIEQRKKSGESRNDFLQLVVDAELRNRKTLNKTPEESDISSGTILSKSLNYDELVAQCVSFFTAGYDSTTSLLSHIAYNLSIHPECQQKLLSEIDSVVKKYTEVTYDAISEMKYLDAVISECLRLCPPVVRLERRAAADYKFEDSGITIKKGMLVSIPVFAMHYDPEWYPDPEKFNPNRFIDNKASHHPYTYLPFGTGPRVCIGMRFVLMEVKTCLVKILLQFRFAACEETQVPLGYKEAQGVVSPNPITVKIVKRYL